MTIGSILLGIALLVLVGLFLARPFILPAGHFRGRLAPRQALAAHKEALLAQIQALEFDYETGKIPEAVYQQERAEKVAEAAAVLQELDQMPAVSAGGSLSDIDAEIEAAVARLRHAGPPAAGDTAFCPHCGQPVDADDNFCAACGHELAHKQPA